MIYFRIAYFIHPRLRYTIGLKLSTQHYLQVLYSRQLFIRKNCDYTLLCVNPAYKLLCFQRKSNMKGPNDVKIHLEGDDSDNGHNNHYSRNSPHLHTNNNRRHGHGDRENSNNELHMSML